MKTTVKGLVCVVCAVVLSSSAALLTGCAGLVSSANSTDNPPSSLVVTNVQTGLVTTASSQVIWATNVPADSSVDYGTTTAYGNSTPVDPGMVTSHQVTLSNLAAGTTYYFQVNSTDSKGNHGHGANKFLTAGFSLSGTINPATGGSGSTLTLSGKASATTMADSLGNYTFAGLANGTYTIVPSHAGYTFTPSSQSTPVNGVNVIGVNFTDTAAAVVPTITTQPVNQTVTAGQTATFAVVAAGTAPLAYQWQKNGVNIAGATATSYTTPVTTTADSGSTFSVVVNNTAGTITSSPATLTVNAAAVAPTITAQPVNQTVTAGQTATFTAVAAGTAPLAYQWQKNGVNIAGATATSYSTPVTTAADSGSTFAVVVTNTAGTVTSAAATLTVNAAAVAPTITTQPVNQTVTAGQTATFTAVAAGTAPLAYQWQKNGVNIAGATATSYSTPVTTAADSGSTFRVVVTNSAGTVTSAAATLTVNAAAVAPTITTQPVNQTVTAGQTATFTAVAAGTAPLTYQWQKNGVNIAGATATSYTTPVTTTADSGTTFAVVVSNTAGTITSSPATLTVNAAAVAPTITTQPVNQTVTAGQTATFTVVAAGTAPLAYQWQKSGVNIAGATATSYTTPATATTDSGSTFRVVVTNTAGTVTSAAATLTVNAAAVAPTITTQPVNQTVTAGQTATFTAVAAGTAPLAYQWQKNGVNIAGATASSYTTPATATSDSGSAFRVVVTNTAGTVTSSAATLTVNAAAVAPTITTQPVNQTVTAGQTATFTAVAAGTAPLAYQWQKNGVNIAGATATSYSTPVTTTADSGSTFRVVVTNTAGTVTSSAATLTVNAVVDTTPPTVPTGLTAAAASSSQINLSWTASTDNVGVTGYKVFRSGTQVGTSAGTSYSDAGLTASTAYAYTVAAYDSAGNTSAQSATASATTLASSGGGIPSTLGWYQIPNTQLAPLCPNYAEIQGNSGCAAVMSAWSGGLYDPQRSRFIITGGGHNDYFGNEVYTIDFSGGTPTRLLVHDASHGSGFSVTDNETMPDGNPTPRHTYGCLTYFPTQDEYIYCGGGSNVNGNIENGMWRYNPKTNTWTNVTPSGGPNWATNGTTPKMAYDSVTNAGYALADAAPGTFFRWNPTTHTWTSLGTISGAPCTGSPVGSGGTGKDNNVVIAPDYRFYVCAGNGNLQAVNLNTFAVQNDSNASGCSALANGPGPGLTYDPVQKLVVGWVGGNSVIEYNPSSGTVSGVGPRSCSTVTFAGGPGAQQGNGTYGRFQYSPNLGVFVVANSISQNVYSLRLTPVSGGTSGPAISGVSVNSITTVSANIIWTTDVPATSQVEYGLTTTYGTLTTLNATLVTSHSVALGGLATNMLYHYRVRTKNSSGVESVGVDAVFQTNNTTDTTSPTVSVTAPAGGATVSGLVSVSANASDNVAVASVQLLLDGASLGAAKITAPYSTTWDTTTSSNGTHTLGATATDTSGNVGNATSVTVNVSNASPSSNFQTLCTAPGVVKCVAWDNASDFTPASGGAGYASGLYPAEDGVYEGVQDTTSKVDGAGSLKFVIRAGSVHPHGTNPAGYWLQQFGTDNAATKYGEGTTLYLQFRFMVSPEMLNYDWTQAGGEGWKVFIVWGPIPGQSCTGDQFVQENTNQTNVATAYVSCGSPGLYTNNGNPPMNIEQGDYNCAYAGGGAPYTGPNCFVYPASTWITEYWVVHIGTYGQPNTTFQAWIAPEGQPLKQFINLPNFTFGDPSDHTVGLQGIILQPYFSGANGSTTTPAAAMWFDDLIISTQPIGAPTN